MEPVFNPFEVLSLFAEVVVGQLGFQVVAVDVGRRGGGSDWSKGDTRLFFAMISCGAFAISLAFSPIFLISELSIFSESNVDNMLYFSSQERIEVRFSNPLGRANEFSFIFSL